MKNGRESANAKTRIVDYEPLRERLTNQHGQGVSLSQRSIIHGEQKVMKRSTRSVIARETVDIVEREFYVLADGRKVHLKSSIQTCLEGTRTFSPEELEKIQLEVWNRPTSSQTTIMEVRNETTLEGIHRLALEGETGRTMAALNFGSAKNPGGGFLGGSQAQEESLARSSALYASLTTKAAQTYYEHHRQTQSCLYSDRLIISPNCPFFRSDDGQLWDNPIEASIITGAAPNKGAIATNNPEDLRLIPNVIRNRIEGVLALGAWLGYSCLILGAWGCGVFRNDPAMVASTFADVLRQDVWRGRFRRIVFSIYDSTAAQTTLQQFANQLGDSQ